MTFSSAGLIFFSGAIFRGGTGGAFMCMRRSAIESSLLNGFFPVHIP